MFGAGWTEMLIIGVVALVVIGPKDLPIVMRKLGRVVATVRRMGSDFQQEINKTTGLDQITDLRRSITEPLRQTHEPKSAGESQQGHRNWALSRPAPSSQPTRRSKASTTRSPRPLRQRPAQAPPLLR